MSQVKEPPFVLTAPPAGGPSHLAAVIRPATSSYEIHQKHISLVRLHVLLGS